MSAWQARASGAVSLNVGTRVHDNYMSSQKVLSMLYKQIDELQKTSIVAYPARWCCMADPPHYVLPPNAV